MGHEQLLLGFTALKAKAGLHQYDLLPFTQGADTATVPCRPWRTHLSDAAAAEQPG